MSHCISKSISTVMLRFCYKHISGIHKVNEVQNSSIAKLKWRARNFFFLSNVSVHEQGLSCLKRTLLLLHQTIFFKKNFLILQRSLQICGEAVLQMHICNVHNDGTICKGEYCIYLQLTCPTRPLRVPYSFSGSDRPSVEQFHLLQPSDGSLHTLWMYYVVGIENYN